MKISDLDHMENASYTLITGGAISLTFDAPINVVFIAASEQNATGKFATNKANVGINFFDKVDFKF